MAHPEQRDFFTSVSHARPWFFTGVRVLEVGSLDINGTVRDFFTDCDYIGVDVASGPGVDVVAQGQDLDYPDRHFDTVISAECFEHNPYWLETFVNMHRMCSGLVTFSCASEGRAEHGTARSDPGSSPLTVRIGWNYYRNLVEADFTDALDLETMFTEWGFSGNAHTCDLYFYGLVR